LNVPIHSFGIGNAIPEDYELATKERVADLIFSLSKIKK
jgi:flagellar biosynthesis protein FlhF